MVYKLETVVKPVLDFTQVEGACVKALGELAIENSSLPFNYVIGQSDEGDEIFLRSWAAIIAAIAPVISGMTPSYSEKTQRKLLDGLDLKKYKQNYVFEGDNRKVSIVKLLEKARSHYITSAIMGEAGFLSMFSRLVSTAKYMNQMVRGKATFGPIIERELDFGEATKTVDNDHIWLGIEHLEGINREVIIRSDEKGPFFYHMYGSLKSITNAAKKRIVCDKKTNALTTSYDGDQQPNKVSIKYCMKKSINFSIELLFAGIIPEDPRQIEFLRTFHSESNYLDSCSQFKYHINTHKSEAIQENWSSHGANQLPTKFDRRMRSAEKKTGSIKINLDNVTLEDLPLLSIKSTISETATARMFLNFVKNAHKRIEGEMSHNKELMMAIMIENWDMDTLYAFYKRNKNYKSVSERIMIHLDSSGKPNGDIEEKAKKIKNVLSNSGLEEEWRNKFVAENLLNLKLGKNVENVEKMSGLSQSEKEELKSVMIKIYNQELSGDSLTEYLKDDQITKIRALELKTHRTKVEATASVSDETVTITANGEDFLLKRPMADLVSGKERKKGDCEKNLKLRVDGKPEWGREARESENGKGVCDFWYVMTRTDNEYLIVSNFGKYPDLKAVKLTVMLTAEDLKIDSYWVEGEVQSLAADLLLCRILQSSKNTDPNLYVDFAHDLNLTYEIATVRGISFFISNDVAEHDNDVEADEDGGLFDE